MTNDNRFVWERIARPQVLIGLALIALMAVTRGHHFASVDFLPSASWAVFFIAGVYLKPRWSFPLFMAEAVLLDCASLAAGTSIGDCITPSYVALVPAYAALWFAGRWFAKDMALNASGVLRLIVSAFIGLLLAQLIASGSYYLFSGKFTDPTVSEFADRMMTYTPRKFEGLAFYIGVAACVHVMSFELRRFMQWTGLHS